ncbi:MAG: cytidylate kinase family protein [Clostridiales bacterium]|nr:cytidylate kinase family protein [Clostridiales bacterium]
MYITITGELGSGKSTVANLLCDKYGFTKYSTGTIQREIAKEKGITTLELNQQMSNDVNNKYDSMIDNKTVEISRANIGKDIVFDSRMAWHFVEQSFKVYVTVDIHVAANRVIMADRGQEEHYDSLEEAAKSLIKRKQLEDSRFAQIYFVNTTDFDNYDLIVDSTVLTPSELAEFIIEKAKAESYKHEVFLSPQRLYPTCSVNDVKSGSTGEPQGDTGEAIDVAVHEGFYYIISGHGMVYDKIKSGEKLIRANVYHADDNGMVGKFGKNIEELVKRPEENYREWEEYTGVKFLAYPY